MKMYKLFKITPDFYKDTVFGYEIKVVFPDTRPHCYPIVKDIYYFYCEKEARECFMTVINCKRSYYESQNWYISFPNGVVKGLIWPDHGVEPRSYFRIENGFVRSSILDRAYEMGLLK